jgi:hypothetical protein
MTIYSPTRALAWSGAYEITLLPNVYGGADVKGDRPTESWARTGPEPPHPITLIQRGLGTMSAAWRHGSGADLPGGFDSSTPHRTSPVDNSHIPGAFSGQSGAGGFHGDAVVPRESVQKAPKARPAGSAAPRKLRVLREARGH